MPIHCAKALRGWSFGCLLIVALISGASHAGSITYDVDQTIGPDSIVGTIETTGATGVLTVGDFTAWNLLLSDGTTSSTLTSGNSFVNLSGIDTTATLTRLNFNFNGTDQGYFSFEASFGTQYYCNSAASTVYCLQGESIVPVRYNIDLQNAALTGNVAFASVAAVPEPATTTLAALGFLGLAIVNKRRWRVSRA